MIGHCLFTSEGIRKVFCLYVAIFEIPMWCFIKKLPACWGTDVSIDIFQFLLLCSITSPWLNSRHEVQSARILNGIRWLWVQMPLWATFYSYFYEWFSSGHHMYPFILLNSCDYLNKILIKTNVATEEENSENDIWHWKKDEIGEAVQSWLWMKIELMPDSSVC